MRGAGPGRGAGADAALRRACACACDCACPCLCACPDFAEMPSVVGNPVAGIRVFAPNGADLADCSGQAEAALGARASVERPWVPGERRDGRPGGPATPFFVAALFRGFLLVRADPTKHGGKTKRIARSDRIGMGANRPRRADLKTMGGMQEEALTSPTSSNHGAGARPGRPVAGARRNRNPAASTVG